MATRSAGRGSVAVGTGGRVGLFVIVRERHQQPVAVRIIGSDRSWLMLRVMLSHDRRGVRAAFRRFTGYQETAETSQQQQGSKCNPPEKGRAGRKQAPRLLLLGLDDASRDAVVEPQWGFRDQTVFVFQRPEKLADLIHFCDFLTAYLTGFK